MQVFHLLEQAFPLQCALMANTNASDAVVTPAMADDAFSFADGLDSDSALGWLYQTEPALARKIRSAGQDLLRRLEEHHDLQLSLAQRAAVLRTICNTAVAAVKAVSEGHFLLWQSLAEGPLVATADPWSGVGRLVAVESGPLRSAKGRRGSRQRKVSHQNGREVMATKLTIRSCVPARDQSVASKSRVLVLTSATADHTVRHEMISKGEAEALLKALVHALSNMGSRSAAEAWPIICGKDAGLDPPRQKERPTPGRDDQGEDGDGDANSHT